jgi:hypothetical protein
MNLKKQGVRMWTILICLRIGPNGRSFSGGTLLHGVNYSINNAHLFQEHFFLRLGAL